VSANGKWLHFQNQTLSFVPWPKGSRDMHLLFFEYISVNTDTGKTSTKLYNSKLGNMFPSFKSAPSVKHKLSNMFDNSPLEKKTSDTTTKTVLTGFDMPLVLTEWPEYRYYPVDEEWQCNACRQCSV